MTFAQTDSLEIDSTANTQDSVKIVALQEYEQRLAEIEKLRVADSLKKVDLEIQLKSLKTTDNLKKEELLKQLKTIEESEKERVENKKARIELLRNTIKGFPVVGVL